MKAVFPRSLRGCLLVLVAALILPGAGLTLFENLEKRSAAAETVQERALHAARSAARSQRALLESARLRVEALAQAPEITGCDPLACGRLIDELVPPGSGIEVEIREPGGTFWAGAATRTGGTETLGPRPVLDFLSLEPVVGPAQAVPARPGAGTLDLVMLADGGPGRPERVVVARVDLRRFAGEIAGDGLPDGATLWVSDARGSLLWRHPEAQSWPEATRAALALLAAVPAAPEGTTRGTTPGGEECLLGFATLEETAGFQGSIAISVPVAIAFGPADAALGRDLLVLGLVALVIGAGVWTIGDRLVLRPLGIVGAAASRLAGGDLAARTGIQGPDEIGRLGRAFDAMAARLQETADQGRAHRDTLTTKVRCLVEERTREVTALNHLVQVLHACRTAEEACRIVAASMGGIFHGDAGAFLVMDPSRRALRSITSFGGAGAEDARTTFDPETCWAVRRGRIHIVPDTGQGPVCRHLAVAGPAAALCVPIVAQDGVLGVLHLARAGSGCAEEWIASREKLAATVAEQCALAIDNLTLRETLREQSLRDPLTGLFNRRYLDETLDRRNGRLPAPADALGVVMVDIDHFKRFNDAYGHAVGDAVLAAVGRRLARAVRREDLVCRVGGEEFVVVLPGASLDRSLRRAEELRRRVALLRVRHRGRTYGPITVSLGVAAMPVHGRDPEALLVAADAALYQAKLSGRNRVAVAETSVRCLARD